MNWIRPQSTREYAACWMWSVVFILIAHLLPLFFAWQFHIAINGAFFASLFAMEGKQAAFLTGLVLVSWLLIRLLQRKTRSVDAWWWLAGPVIGVLWLLIDVFPVHLPDSVSLIQFLISHVLPDLANGYILCLLLMHGGLLCALAYALFGMAAGADLLESSTFMILLDALIPMIFLLVLNMDFAEEETKEEPAEKEKKKPAWLGWSLQSLFVGSGLLLLLFSLGILPWIPTAIATGSMEPALQVGDMAVIDTGNTHPREGDIIQFQKDGISVVHRVTEVVEEENSTAYITQGDNNNVDDGLIPAEDVDGVMISSIPKLGWLTLWLHMES